MDSKTLEIQGTRIVDTLGLEGEALNWAVAKALGKKTDTCGVYKVSEDMLLKELLYYCSLVVGDDDERYYINYSDDWLETGKIIDAEGIGVLSVNGNTDWVTHYFTAKPVRGKTAIEAVLRCFVLKECGQEIAIPVELLEYQRKTDGLYGKTLDNH